MDDLVGDIVGFAVVGFELGYKEVVGTIDGCIDTEGDALGTLDVGKAVGERS